MAKQDVLDAINATIAPNGIKGITAQSLNNILTMMTENAGEGGSGDGALKVIVPDMLLLGPEIVAMGELSPASWEEMKPIIEADGIDVSEYDAVVKAAFEHNANVAQQIIEKGKAGQGVSIVLDQTPYSSAAINVSFQMTPEMAEVTEEAAVCVVQPAGFSLQYINVTPEGEAITGGDMFECVLAPAGNINIDGWSMTYPSNMLIFLNLDGSLTFTQIEEEEQPSSGSGVGALRVWINEENTPEQIAENAATYNAIKNNNAQNVIAVTASNAYESTITRIFNVLNIVVLSGDLNDVVLTFAKEWENGIASLASITLYEDGTFELA